MIDIKDLYAWQQRLLARPRIWTVVHSDGESTGNYYDTRDAAEHEIRWYAKYRPAERVRISCIGNVHDDQLSRERWT